MMNAIRRRWGLLSTIGAVALLAAVISFAALYTEVTMGETRRNTEVLPLDADAPQEFDTATFAMGCFWGPDARFGILPGVLRTRVGYAGGTTEHPSYYNIGDHAEAVQIDFDVTVISYEELLQYFFAARSPSAPSLMGAGQYRSLLLVHSDEQRQKAEDAVKAGAGPGGDNLLDQLVQPLGEFTQAEDYHQKYHLQRERALYVELLDKFALFSDFVDSTVVARVNGYLAGWGTTAQLEKEIESFGLSEAAAGILRGIVR